MFANPVFITPGRDIRKAIVTLIYISLVSAHRTQFCLISSRLAHYFGASVGDLTHLPLSGTLEGRA